MLENNDWNVESLRLTLFVDDYKINKNLFLEITNNEPDNTSFRKIENIYQEEGFVDTNKLVVFQGLGRIDIVILKEPSSESMRKLAEWIDIFSNILNNWINNTNLSVKRLAFASLLKIYTNNNINAYEIIEKYLPRIKIDKENSMDFSYQISRPKQSNVLNSLKINSFSKWSVLIVKSLIINNNNKTTYSEDKYLCQLELDINTDIENKQDLSNISEIFNELKEKAIHISINGDE